MNGHKLLNWELLLSMLCDNHLMHADKHWQVFQAGVINVIDCLVSREDVCCIEVQAAYVFRGELFHCTHAFGNQMPMNNEAIHLISLSNHSNWSSSISDKHIHASIDWVYDRIVQLSKDSCCWQNALCGLSASVQDSLQTNVLI